MKRSTRQTRRNGSALAAAQQSQKSAPAADARQWTPAREIWVWRRLLRFYAAMTPDRRIAEHRKIVRLASQCLAGPGKGRMMRIMFAAGVVVLIRKVAALLTVTPQQFIAAVIREYLDTMECAAAGGAR